MTESIANRIAHFTGVSGVDAFVLHASKRADACRCTDCGGCDSINTHRYGAFEAQRWDGDYIYYCPQGFVFIVVIINEERDTCVAGPMTMGESDGCRDGIRTGGPSDVPQNGLYEAVDEIRLTENVAYPIELEQKLQAAIISGDERNAKEYLNLLLGHIFFSSNADFEIIKHG